jgi:hypothetical protein
MTFRERAIGAAKLDISVFEDVEADRGATGQALVVVVLSSAAAAIGLTTGTYDAPLMTRVVLALLLWLFWAALTCGIGLYLLPEPQTDTSIGELLRTIGFAASPGTLRVLGFLPLVGRAIYAVGTVWMLIAMVIAIRQALDYRSTGRAILVCVIAWVIAVALAALIGGLLFSAADALFS